MNKPIIGAPSPVEVCEECGPTIKEIEKSLGEVPNVYLTAAHSPAALQSLWFQVGAAAQMRLPARHREMVALRVAQFNGCSYSLAAHTAAAEKVGIDSEQALKYRGGKGDDDKEQALLDLVTRMVEHRGHHSGFEVERVRKAGFTDSEIVEVIALIGLYTYTNYLDCVANTKLDYPPVENLSSE